jgi:hypothetical protein
MMRRIQKNAFGRSIQIPLCDICLGAVAGLGTVAALAAAVDETLKDDHYCYGNVVDFDSDDFDSDDLDHLRGVSLSFEGLSEDLGTVVADVDAVVRADYDAHSVGDAHYHACCHHCYYSSWYYQYRLYYYRHGKQLDWAFAADTLNLAAAYASCVDDPPNRNRYCLAGQRRAAVAALKIRFALIRLSKR